MSGGEKERLALRLRPYQHWIAYVYSVVVWKKPMVLATFLAHLNSLLLFAYSSSMGLFALFALVFLISYAVAALNRKFGVLRFLGRGPEGNNDAVEFRAVCSAVVALRLRLAMISEYVLGAQFGHGLAKLLYVSAVWLTLAYVLNIIGRFWPLMVLLNAGILGTGVILSPEVREGLSQRLVKPKTD